MAEARAAADQAIRDRKAAHAGASSSGGGGGGVSPGGKKKVTVTVSGLPYQVAQKHMTSGRMAWLMESGKCMVARWHSRLQATVIMTGDIAEKG